MSAPPEVALVAPAPPPLGGQSAYSLYLRDRLTAAGFGVRFHPLVTRDPREGPRGFFRKATRGLSVVASILAGPRPRHAMVVLDSGFGLLIDCLAVLALRARGARVVVSHHTFKYVDAKSTLFDLLLRAGGPELAHAFLCERMASGFAALYPNRLGAQRYIVGNSRRTEPPAGRREPRADEAFTVGFLSNLSFEKGLERYFEVVRALSARAPGVKGLLAGPASTEAVEAYVRRELAASPNVEWLGGVYGPQKADFFGRIDAFVFPTVYENEAQPNVLFEALAFGVPVATLRRGCIGEDLAQAGSLVADGPERFCADATDFLAEMAGSAGRAKLAERRAQARARFDALRGRSLDVEAALFDRFRR